MASDDSNIAHKSYGLQLWNVYGVFIVLICSFLEFDSRVTMNCCCMGMCLDEKLFVVNG